MCVGALLWAGWGLLRYSQQQSAVERLHVGAGRWTLENWGTVYISGFVLKRSHCLNKAIACAQSQIRKVPRHWLSVLLMLLCPCSYGSQPESQLATVGN